MRSALLLRRLAAVRAWIVLLLAMVTGCHSETVVQGPRVDGETGTVLLSSYLYRPVGKGPFPAVVLLHGCAGVLSKHKRWGERLSDWGYVALLVDSFQPRGVDRICEASDDQWQRFNVLRMADARGAARYLRQQEFVDSRRLGVIGWSNGGTIVLDLASDAASPEQQFSAAVAFYPSCWQILQENPVRLPSVVMPLMIAMGANDNWTHPSYCRAWLQTADPGHRADLNLYPGAWHDFDNPEQRLLTLAGVRVEGDGDGYGEVIVGYDKAADRQAQTDLQNFLRGHLHP